MSETKSAADSRPPERDRVLGPLMDEVDLARCALRHRLDSGRPGDGPRLVEARNDVRAALDRLVEALVARRLPVPRKIHDELALITGLCQHPSSHQNSRS